MTGVLGEKTKEREGMVSETGKHYRNRSKEMDKRPLGDSAIVYSYINIHKNVNHVLDLISKN